MEFVANSFLFVYHLLESVFAGHPITAWDSPGLFLLTSSYTVIVMLYGLVAILSLACCALYIILYGIDFTWSIIFPNEKDPARENQKALT